MSLEVLDDFFFPKIQGRSSMDLSFWHQKRSSLEKSLRSLSLRECNSLHAPHDEKKASSVSTNSTKIFHDFICTLKSVNKIHIHVACRVIDSGFAHSPSITQQNINYGLEIMVVRPQPHCTVLSIIKQLTFYTGVEGIFFTVSPDNSNQ